MTLAAMMTTPVATWVLLGPAESAPAVTRLAVQVPTTASATTILSLSAPVTGSTFLPWVVALWLAGALAFSVRLAGGWLVAIRLRTTLVRPAPEEWRTAFEHLKARLGVSDPVRLLVSPLAQVPTVVGWLYPVVLAPLGALTGLPSEHVEALLIHELANIRRRDYLVNILQSVVETLLFYHPAVWWLSGHMRAEREMCCDDIAVAVSGDAFTYARALAELESLRPEHLDLALAANGGSLADRIGRLLGKSRLASGTLTGPEVIVSAILLLITAYGMFGQAAASPRFEVASVKRTARVVNRMIVAPRPGGRLVAENAPLWMLIQNAYKLERYQISGGPGWIESDHFDIEAKAEGNASREQLFLMLQGLLEDRFKLKTHRETKELPVYALTVGRGGFKPPTAEGRKLHSRQREHAGCASTTSGPRAAAFRCTVRADRRHDEYVEHGDAGRQGTHPESDRNARDGDGATRDRQDWDHGHL